MSWLFAPNAMAFITSAVSVLMMAFSKFEFVRLYFFAPLAIAVGVSYFFGGVALPCLLGCLNCIPALCQEEKIDAMDGSQGPPPKVEPKTPLNSEQAEEADSNKQEKNFQMVEACAVADEI
jgi:hypothetical protein